MSGASSIEWTDATWNPVRGCSRVSEGCRNCYAARHAARFSDEGTEMNDVDGHMHGAMPFAGFAIGEEVTLPGWSPGEVVTGRWVHAWNNIGRLVLPDGTARCVSTCHYRRTAE